MKRILETAIRERLGRDTVDVLIKRFNDGSFSVILSEGSISLDFLYSNNRSLSRHAGRAMADLFQRYKEIATK